MFNNPGSKIKGLAKVIFYLLLITFCAGGIFAIVQGVRMVIAFKEYYSYYYDSVWDYVTEWSVLQFFVYGILGIVGGILIAWLSTLFTYAFGCLVDDVQNIRSKLEYQSYQPSYQPSPEPAYQPSYQPSSEPAYQPSYQQSSAPSYPSSYQSGTSDYRSPYQSGPSDYQTPYSSGSSSDYQP